MYLKLHAVGATQISAAVVFVGTTEQLEAHNRLYAIAGGSAPCCCCCCCSSRILVPVCAAVLSATRTGFASFIVS